MNTKQVLIGLGALAAIVSQWWGANYYLAVIGGVLVIIGAWVMK